MSMKKFGCFLAIAAGAAWIAIEWLCFGPLAAAIAGIGFAMGCVCTVTALGTARDSRELCSCACWSASLIDEDRRLYDIQVDLADEDAMAAIGSILGRKTGGDAHGDRSAD